MALSEPPLSVATRHEKKPHIGIPIEDFAVEYGIPIDLVVCLVGKTEKETDNNIELFKKYLKDGYGFKIAGKRPDDKFSSALTEKNIGDVVKAYFVYDGNATRAEEKLPYTRKTIAKYWKMFGLNLVMGAPSKSEKVTISKDSGTFSSMIKDTKKWIDEKIEVYRKEIENMKIGIEKINNVAEGLKKKRKGLEIKIEEYEVIIEDSLECSKGFLEFSEDICKNRGKAEFYRDNGLTKEDLA